MTSYYKIVTQRIMSGLFTILSLCFCEKGWLEEKSDITLTVPNTIPDLQKLLDNSAVFNRTGLSLGELSADNIFMTPSVWQSAYSVEKNAYVWESDIYQDVQFTSNWDYPYTRIYYANTALEGAGAIMRDDGSSIALDNIRGSALFYRAFAHFEVANIFAPQYIAATAPMDMGIPLRMSSDFNIPSVRASLKTTYEQIIQDLQDAKNLLPVLPLYKSRPSKTAAFALLARVCVSMEDYNNARIYADSALAYNYTLLNYNTLNAASSAPIPLPASNTELIFFNTLPNIGSLRNAFVDTTLFASYNSNDLRRSVFFSSLPPTLKFKGNYNSLTAISYFFNGLATDELYLIKAECLARQGQTQPAMDVLNTLLLNRWVTGTFINLTATDAEDALTQILTERKKELLYRGLRWTDLKRLNRDNRFAATLTRKINSDVYTLMPGDLRYVHLLPPDVIRYSGMPQNPR